MKKKMLSAVLLLTMAVSLVACGDKETAKKADDAGAGKKADISASEVIAKMSEAETDVEGVDATVNFNFDADISAGDEKDNVVFKGDMNVKSNIDPIEAYIGANLSVKASGESSDVNYDIYMVAEDDVCNLYFGNDTDGWMKTEMSLDELGLDDMKNISGDTTDLEEFYSEENIEKYFDDVKVTEKKIDGKDCYSVKGDVSKELLETAIDSINTLAGLNIEVPDLKITLEICSDKKTGSAVEINVKADAEENDNFKLSACEFSLKYNEVGKQDITIPDEALEAQDISGLSLY